MTDTVDVERLVRELVATGAMWPETIEDLERFAAEARAGTLSPDDLSYLVAFHAKNVLEASPEAVLPGDTGGAPMGDARFEEIRRRFEDRYGPGNLAGDGAEQEARARVFADFWPEFDAVDRS